MFNQTGAFMFNIKKIHFIGISGTLIGNAGHF